MTESLTTADHVVFPKMNETHRKGRVCDVQKWEMNLCERSPTGIKNANIYANTVETKCERTFAPKCNDENIRFRITKSPHAETLLPPYMKCVYTGRVHMALSAKCG